MASNAARYREGAWQTESRSEPRLPVVITRATMRKTGGEPVDAILHDLSIYGCRVMSNMSWAEGDKLLLRFAGATPVAATVAWSDGTFTGCRFKDPISTTLFRSFTLSGYKPGN